jgi:hypothetical protein
MPVITIFIELLTAFRDGEIIIVTPGCSDIKEIGSSLSGSDTFTIDALHPFFVVFVRHRFIFWF